MTSPLSQEAEQVKPTRDNVSRMDGWMNTCTDAREDGWRHARVDGRRRESINEPQKTLGQP